MIRIYHGKKCGVQSTPKALHTYGVTAHLLGSGVQSTPVQ